MGRLLERREGAPDEARDDLMVNGDFWFRSSERLEVIGYGLWVRGEGL